ncbi:MAG: glycoside hydrolase family 5 protein [Alphaproteobacteria bacterium]|nr:glycoside hydrolase family 5 protein [Alphaproteobacteria bacterium]
MNQGPTAPGRRRILLAAGAAALSLAVPGPTVAQGAGPLPRRGVNLSHWLSWDGRQPIAPVDARLIRAAGFDHVRLPVDPEFLGWAPPDQGLPPRLDRLDAALKMLLDAGLAVILSFHARDNTRDQIELRRPFQEAYLAFWLGLARRYAGLPADRLIFAVMNEPQYYVRGAQRWHQLQQSVVQAIRAEDPRRMLALAGIGGSSIDYIERTGVIRDPNSFFVFHYYEPYLVSHFGASWEPFTKEPGALVGRVVYPSTEMSLAAAAIRLGPQRAAAEKLVRAYIDKPWTAETIERRIAIAASWAARSGVRLMCTEFGVLRVKIDASSRYRWLADVRTALERHGIGWSVWDYADLFGIATARGNADYLGDGAIVPRDPANPRREFEPGALAALGL